MRFGSLFSGIGGIDLGLERAGMECIWQVELDPFCQAVLEKHWPDVWRTGDVRALTKEDFDGLPEVDLIAGGFPCQDISQAGQRAGIEGERSGLWAEFARLIRELRPEFVLVENVADLLARGMGVVLGDLAACGYAAVWDCVPAAAVGAPHLRDRVWVVAHTDADRLQDERGRSLFDGLWPTPWRDADGRDGARAWPPPQASAVWSGLPTKAQPTVCRGVDGFSGGMDRARLASVGNAAVPQIVERIGRRMMRDQLKRTESED